MLEIGFTGTRLGMTIPQHMSVTQIMFNQYRRGIRDGFNTQWHHGVCIGSDFQVHDLVLLFEFNIHGHPPEDEKYMASCTGFNELSSPKPYLQRNHDIVDACTTLIATPKENHNVLRSGTWATIRYAKGLGIDVAIIIPSGHMI